jgi:hypothetical protein
VTIPSPARHSCICSALTGRQPALKEPIAHRPGHTAKVICNSGCHCAGIGDAALHVTDTVLHFFYNAVTYGAILAAYWFVARARPRRDRGAPLESAPWPRGA